MHSALHFLTAALPLAAAWPTVMDTNDVMQKRYTNPTVPPPKITPNRDNCGSAGPCTAFSAADQYVDVSQSSGHEWQAPTSTDLRGQCPGLNAAANHGFLPRNGIASIQETIDGLGAAYNMSPDLALVLAVLSIGICGDPIAETWSIGGSFPGSLGLLGTPTGILGTHNRYEGDASIVRGDAFMHNGSVDVFEMPRWERIYGLTHDGGFTHNKAANQAYWTARYSIENNPEYFSAPFSGLVAPDAHNFVVNLMSNHTAENPGGYLDEHTLKSFFAVTGKPGSFVHHPYMERIPNNWYRRPSTNQMSTTSTNTDTVVNNLMYPGVINFGGNTGTVNSFAGIDTGDLTGGTYSDASLLKGNNLACFFLQASQQSLLDSAYPLTEPVGVLTSFLRKTLGPQAKKLGCPKLNNFNNTLFAAYPGATYQAQGE